MLRKVSFDLYFLQKRAMAGNGLLCVAKHCAGGFDQVVFLRCWTFVAICLISAC